LIPEPTIRRQRVAGPFGGGRAAISRRLPAGVVFIGEYRNCHLDGLAALFKGAASVAYSRAGGIVGKVSRVARVAHTTTLKNFVHHPKETFATNVDPHFGVTGNIVLFQLFSTDSRCTTLLIASRTTLLDRVAAGSHGSLGRKIGGGGLTSSFRL
jgi:hypothetical protein